MNHLTQEQIFAFIDGNFDDALEHQINAHLAACTRCNNEVALQRALLRTARELPLSKTSRGFTERVMGRVLRPARNNSLSYKILQNLGYVFAMMIVLAVLGYFLTNPSALFVKGADTQPSELSRAWKTFSTEVGQFLTLHTTQLSQTVAQKKSTPISRIITVTVFVLIAFGVLDRFVLQKVVRMKL